MVHAPGPRPAAAARVNGERPASAASAYTARSRSPHFVRALLLARISMLH